MWWRCLDGKSGVVGGVRERLPGANALLLLDEGMSCEAIAKVLFRDDDTVHTWYHLYQEDGIEGLASFGHEGGAYRLSDEQQDKLKASSDKNHERPTLKHGCLRLTPAGDSGAACDVIEAAGWSGGQPAWELPTRLICGYASCCGG